MGGLFSFLFPETCYGCKRQGSYICPACAKTMHPHPDICIFCHAPSHGGKTCYTCRYQGRLLDGCVVGFSYSGVIKTCIKRLKFSHRSHTAQILAQKIALLLQTHPVLSGSSLIVPVPSHRWRKYIQKGYNQSELLAKQLATITNHPYHFLLTKNRHTKSQVGLSKQERQKNLTDAFVCTKNLPSIEGRNSICIVDDVVTTGSTLEQIARTIKKNYPSVQVWGLCLARN